MSWGDRDDKTVTSLCHPVYPLLISFITLGDKVTAKNQKEIKRVKEGAIERVIAVIGNFLSSCHQMPKKGPICSTNAGDEFLSLFVTRKEA